MNQRMFIINEDGRQHQSWDLEDSAEGLVLVLDIKPGHNLPMAWGLYIEKDYIDKVYYDYFIQSRLDSKHKDYNKQYKIKKFYKAK